MDDASSVRCGQGLRQPDAPIDDPPGGQGAGGLALVETRAVDDLHRQETPAVGFLERVEDHDVGMVQRRDRPRLALEPREAIGVAGHLGG